MNYPMYAGGPVFETLVVERGAGELLGRHLPAADEALALDHLASAARQRSAGSAQGAWAFEALAALFAVVSAELRTQPRELNPSRCVRARAWTAGPRSRLRAGLDQIGALEPHFASQWPAARLMMALADRLSEGGRLDPGLVRACWLLSRDPRAADVMQLSSDQPSSDQPSSGLVVGSPEFDARCLAVVVS